MPRRDALVICAVSSIPVYLVSRDDADAAAGNARLDTLGNWFDILEHSRWMCGADASIDNDGTLSA